MNKYSIRIPRDKFESVNIDKIREAEKFATQAHAQQRRESGELYILHPVAVAQSLVDWGMDADTIMAGLLHDTVEDTTVTLTDIENKFGLKVSELVGGLTKLSGVGHLPETVGSDRRHSISSENIRKLLLASTHDLRVIVIKLADRLHNLQTLKYCSDAKQYRVALESLEIYAPLADRLGMGQLKAEIEDLGFRYTDPEAYKRVKLLRQTYMKKSKHYLGLMTTFIIQELKKSDINLISVDGREKHLYSVHKKLNKTDGNIDKIYDLIAIRIIVPDVSDCYKVLGILHQQFKPLIYRIKDYIAVPKPNGYRSLHTTVFALDGRITEIQIRTPEMHAEAERGLAAHFYYDANKTAKSYVRGEVQSLPTKLAWVNGLAELNLAATSGDEFVEALKVELFQDRIFVFSPKGDLYDLPEGSTSIDFAFAIHSDIGLRTQGARVNGRLLPLDSRLSNRDVVEIITRKQPSPNRDWLGIVKTPQARNRIKAWFRSLDRHQNLHSGKRVLEQGLKAWGIRSVDDIAATKVKALCQDLGVNDLESVLAMIGEGTITGSQVLRRLFPPDVIKPAVTPKAKSQTDTGRVVVAGRRDLPYSLGFCCKPTFPLPLIGFVTRGKGVTVHLATCTNLPTEANRLIDCRWDTLAGTNDRLLVDIEIEGLNRVGLLRDVTGAISSMEMNISGMTSEKGSEDNQTILKMKVDVKDLFELVTLIRKLERFPGVESVHRI